VSRKGSPARIAAAPELADALELLLADGGDTYCEFCQQYAPQISGPISPRDPDESPIIFGAIVHRPNCVALIAHAALRKAGGL